MYPILTESLSVDKVTIAIADLPPSLEGTKIVQLSDLHYDGQRLSENLLQDAIEASNQEEPDLILLTGDYITDSTKPIEPLVLHLKHLRSRLGIYACLGNHDVYYPNSRKAVVEAMTRIGIEVLWNAIAHPLGAELPIVGLADFWSGEFRPTPVFAQLDPNVPRIVLSHNPDTAAILKKWRVDLQLSGHTHGGQIALPGWDSAPLMLQSLQSHLHPSLWGFVPLMKKCACVVKHWEWGRGLHQIGDNQLYVNRGLGSYFPGRYGCPPEVTVINLVCRGSEL
ncbi:metallophosphoesterase [Lusitaniella coriacea]|uniref:metallophosphoesterase n=1 Tax=Lusitaniella coriacea TaxID=1983105 RepID=UPI003CEE761F